MSKVILSGLAVLVIGSALQVLLPFIAPVLGGIDLTWLADAEITINEVLLFAASIITALATEARNRIMRASGVAVDTY